jgi:hypothetical protein
MVKEIKLNQIYKAYITLLHLMCVSSYLTYLYQSVNGFSLGLAQSYPIKQSLLHDSSLKNSLQSWFLGDFLNKYDFYIRMTFI